MKSNNN